ncbi:RICIN domain-containing protein [Micromonospora sp. WMMD714]|uniref:RICIN domain-containing protein n=1 Tax=Micromonospora sp. WMMD714 TaxID=3016097 RepID=UPI00249BDDA9|nr:RICIN domain-containing protein [Micromonospora sp. WMMD714]WFE62908.1 RICIN domain-containing protein [Micromonospora sp. WMMD714]
MVETSVTLSLGVIKMTLSQKEWASLKRRFRADELFGGPCLLIDRRWGLALDATTEPQERTRPVLWTPHAAPWQQWRIRKVGRDAVKIVSEHGGKALTTDGHAGDRSWVWLETDRNLDSQRWRMTPTDDRVAFLIEANRSAYALDARTDTKVPAVAKDGSIANPTPPILWSTHWEAWQQWLIVRVPLT